MRSLSSDLPISGVFTDLDGTLLDRDTYRWTQARPALDALERRGIPLVIVTSKTMSEVWPLLRALHRRDPFVVENGGAIFVPARYFPFVIPGTRLARRGWREVVLGTPRPRLIRALDRAARLASVRVRGFSQMSVPEVVDLTGLRLGEARAARRRQYDEPFVILGRRADDWPRLNLEIRRLGFDATRGTRLFHITGRSDKGAAILRLIKWFRRAARASSAVGRAGSAAGEVAATRPGLTVGLGDSPNDIPLLSAVDLPIIVAGAGGRYDAETFAAVPRVRRAGGVGPVGWNRSILELLSG